MGLPFNVQSKVHTHMDTHNNFPTSMKLTPPGLFKANTSAHISNASDMPVHYSLAVDPTTINERMPGVTPTGAISYPSAGIGRR